MKQKRAPWVIVTIWIALSSLPLLDPPGALAQAPLANWISVTGPSARALHTMVTDRSNDRVVMFGGMGDNGRMNDVWALSQCLDSGPPLWQPVSPSGPRPVARRAHCAAYDESRDAMYVFGGDRADLDFLNDIWRLDLTPGSESWLELEPLGSPPSARIHGAMIYDELNDRLVVFGGQTEATWFNDVYALDLVTNQWTQLQPSGTPPEARSMAGAVYVPESQEMWLFGGITGGYQDFNDLWSLDLTEGQEAWVELHPSGTLPAGRGVSAVDYDRANARMVVQGGWGLSEFTYYNDTWTLGSDLIWTRIDTGNDFLARRNARGVVYDRAAQAYLIVFGGNWMTGWYFDDTYALRIP